MTELISVLLGAAIGSFVTYWIEHRGERAREIHIGRVKIFSDFVRLRVLYQDLLRQVDHPLSRSNERRRDEISVLANHIAGEVTLSDDLPELPQVVEVLFSTAHFPSNGARLKAMEAVEERMRRDISPKYVQATDAVAKQNAERWLRRETPEAPYDMVIPASFVRSEIWERHQAAKSKRSES
jgi:hypothetical protein